jgi:glycosyltransferase involved in cell wall biosynthesis
MWKAARVAVIVPAYREERLIARTLSRIPAFVDAIFVVDDRSPDQTLAVARAHADARTVCLSHAENRGVGAAILTGYRAALEQDHDVLAVMAGDDQMHPDDLSSLVEPLARGVADYAKGNRFAHPDRALMPRLRRWGGAWLSAVTRFTTGLEVDDTQCGYTALSAGAARRLDLDRLWPRFGYPNDLLLMLAQAGVRVIDVPVRPVYAEERSGIRPWHLVSITGLVAWRYWQARNSRSRFASTVRAVAPGVGPATPTSAHRPC